MELPPYEEYEYNLMYSKQDLSIDTVFPYSSKSFIKIIQKIVLEKRSMMSGHSPVSHHEMFEYAHSTPPSTSKESNTAENVLKSSIVVDTTDSVPTTDVHPAFSSRNNLKFIDCTLPCVDDKVPLAEHEDFPNTSGTSDEGKDDSKLCEDDKPDGTCSQKDETEAQSEEDLCIKCLYVSMQCCECSIM